MKRAGNAAQKTMYSLRLRDSERTKVSILQTALRRRVQRRIRITTTDVLRACIRYAASDVNAFVDFCESQDFDTTKDKGA